MSDRLNFLTCAMRVVRQPHWLRDVQRHLRETQQFVETERFQSTTGSVYACKHGLRDLSLRLHTTRESAFGKWMAAAGLLWQMRIANRWSQRLARKWNQQPVPTDKRVEASGPRIAMPLTLRVARWLEAPSTKLSGHELSGHDSLPNPWKLDSVRPVDGQRVVAVWASARQVRCGLYGSQLRWPTADELSTEDFHTPTCWAYLEEAMAYRGIGKPLSPTIPVLGVTGDWTGTMGDSHCELVVYLGEDKRGLKFWESPRQLWSTLDNRQVAVQKWVNLPYWCNVTRDVLPVVKATEEAST